MLPLVRVEVFEGINLEDWELVMEEVASKEVSISGGSMEMWIQPVGVTLVLRFEAPILSSSVFRRAAIWNCFS